MIKPIKKPHINKTERTIIEIGLLIYLILYYVLNV